MLRSGTTRQHNTCMHNKRVWCVYALLHSGRILVGAGSEHGAAAAAGASAAARIVCCLGLSFQHGPDFVDRLLEARPLLWPLRPAPPATGVGGGRGGEADGRAEEGLGSWVAPGGGRLPRCTWCCPTHGGAFLFAARLATSAVRLTSQQAQARPPSLHECHVGVQALEGGCVEAGQLVAGRHLQPHAIHQLAHQLRMRR